MSKHHHVAARFQPPVQVQQRSEPAPVRESSVNDGLGVIAHAYALVQTPEGRYVTVHLEGVTAQVVERLEPNGRPEIGPLAIERVATAMEKRFRAKKWGAA